MAKRKKGPAPGTAPRKRKKRGAPPGLLGAEPARARGPRRKKAEAAPRARAKAPRAKKAKAPCKYGARTSDGRCPKKPKKAQAVRRDIGTVARPSATAQERAQAAKRLADLAAAEVVRGTTTSLRRTVKSKRGREELKKLGALALAGAKRALPAAGGAVAVGGALAAGAALYSASVRKLANDRIRNIEKKLGPLAPEVRARLLEQHLKQARKDLTLRAPATLR